MADATKIEWTQSFREHLPASHSKYFFAELESELDALPRQLLAELWRSAVENGDSTFALIL